MKHITQSIETAARKPSKHSFLLCFRLTITFIPTFPTTINCHSDMIQQNTPHHPTRKMRSLFSLFPLLFFLFTFHGATSNKLIRNTCKLISKDTPNVKYEFCKTSLEAAWDEDYYPSLATMGSVTLDLVMKNVTNTKSYIEDLKDDTSEPDLSACLSDCLELYSNTISDLEEVVDDYKSRKYNEASEGTNAVLTSLTTCGDGFKERGLASPLIERNDNAFQLSTIAVNILKMLN